jgi:hypothetical protein
MHGLVCARWLPGTLGGMASLTALQREVLSRVAEDYEAAHTITSDIARDLGRAVSEVEVRQCC